MFITFFASLATIALGMVSTSPVWASDPNFRAGVFTAISTNTSAPYSNSYSVPFSSAVVSYPPTAAFGLQTYEGGDYLVQQYFKTSISLLDNTQMTIDFSMETITTLISLKFSYIVVEDAFPYNINMFHNVEINYSSPLTNVTVQSSQLQTHTELVDYSGSQIFNSFRTYISFPPPLSNHKILFFLNSLYIVSLSTVPIQLDLSYQIQSNTTYSMSLTVGYNVSVTYFSFSQIFYDVGDFNGSTISPYLNAYEWDITDYQATNNIIHFDSLLINQLIIGLSTFYTNTGQCSLLFDTQFGNYSGKYGAKLMTPSEPNITSAKVSVLYYMVWSCPIGYPYLNIATQQCQDVCDYYTYANIYDMTCHPCTNALCYTCNSSAPSVCLSCQNYFTLMNNTCTCSMAAFDRVFTENSKCFLCSDMLAHCTSCDYSYNTSLSYNSSYFTCLDCNNTAGYFIDMNNLCSTCSVSHCVTCSGYSACSVCSPGYGLTASLQCSNCPLTGCTTCLNITTCSVCSTGYQKINGSCISCPVTCTCGGYTLPKMPNGDCSAICGDGIIIFPYQQCDDGNKISGDGCSSGCAIESYSICGGQPSLCYLNQNLMVQLISIQVSETQCNTIRFQFQVVPNLLIFQLYPTDWSHFVTSSNATLAYVANSVTETNGVVGVSYTYSQTLQNKDVTFLINPVGIVNSTYLSTVAPFSIVSTVRPTNNLAAIYCSDGTCKLRKSSSVYETAQSTIAYVGLFFSLFSLKIVGLEMFGVIQLSFFILSDYDYVNPLLIGVLGRSQVNGININSNNKGSSSISSRVTLNGFKNQMFLHNFNVMFYLMLALTLVGLLIYNLTYCISRSQQAQATPLKQESVRSHSLKSESGHSHSARSLDEEQHPKQPRVTFWHRMSKYLLKQVLMTFLIFNMFNLSFSAGIQIKYINEVDTWSILAMLFSFTVIIVMVIAQFVADKEQFGEYIDKFKQERLQSAYITVTLIYRFVLGLLMGLLNQWSQSGIVFIFLGGAFLTYIFYSEPFTNPIQNIRSKAVHCVHVLILVVYYYYRMQTGYDQVSSNQFLFPAYVQLISVGVVVIASTSMLGYQIAKLLKQKLCRPNQTKSGQQQNKPSIFESLEHRDNEEQVGREVIKVETLQV